MLVFLVLAMFAIAAFSAPQAQADTIGDQIAALQRENSQNKNAVAQLQEQATSYADAIARLQSQINILQAQIDDNQAKQADLARQIEEARVELLRQRSILGEALRTSYVDGQITTIEMLATSKNLSDFVDKEEYHTAVESKIQETLKKITTLQTEMKQKKTEIDALLVEQQQHRSELDAGRAEQNHLLSMNQGEQASYNQRTRDNQAKIDRLIAEQRRANQVVSGITYFLRFPGSVAPHNPGSNDYPYSGSGFSMSTAPGCNDGDGPDQWGYCTRQCVSYAAWAVQRSGRAAPRYYGNAKDWVAAAYRDGVEVYTSNPRPGDVAISTSGTWGHAMYVEQVSGGQIMVSQYNAALTGQYSTQWRSY